jgi:hypothetical protein
METLGVNTWDELQRELFAKGIQQKMSDIPTCQLPSARLDLIRFNLALAQRIAGIANRSIALGYAMQEAAPPRTLMTQDEAYGQLSES